MESLIIRKALAAVRPVFRLNFQDGVHGVAHWSRVWFHGRRIAKTLDVNPAIVAWFAYLHDSQRHNDHRDPLHGHRAADFALRLRRDGLLVELNDPEFEQLCEAMRLHSDGHVEGEPAIRACWDADRLDLGRVGIDPDPALLCTPAAKRPAVIEEANRMAAGMAKRKPARFV
ncbi:hypothetical protein MCEMSEM47_01263 [Burkholderiales bacterium]